ncbi:MAG: hypothetical protein VKL97_06000 [Cyanobacteriota bacterium]|nr:hypothetical protein [Cyanobacteriota bacterium]
MRLSAALPLVTGLLGTLAAAAVLPAAAQGRCEFLQPVGGNGVTPIITKTISMGNIFGRPNWNTDFYVTKPYNSYKFFFTADSSVSATYPVEGYLKFSDGSNMQVINDPSFAPPMGTGKMWGPYPAYPGKTITQLNFKIGASADQAATGFTYRISTQGCF